MPRMILTPEEAHLIEQHRTEQRMRNAVWNEAIDAVLTALADFDVFEGGQRGEARKIVMELRK